MHHRVIRRRTTQSGVFPTIEPIQSKTDATQTGSTRAEIQSDCRQAIEFSYSDRIMTQVLFDCADNLNAIMLGTSVAGAFDAGFAGR
jgi:hypothetical protein